MSKVTFRLIKRGTFVLLSLLICSVLVSPTVQADPAPVGTEFLVNTTTLNNQEMPAVAMDADGDFVVSWQSYDQDSSGSGIYGQRYDSTGTAQGTEFLVNATTIGHQRRPVVAMDADGDFVVIWENEHSVNSYMYDIYGQRYDSTGVALGTEFRVNTTTIESQEYPAVAMDADGNFVVSWQSYDQDSSGHVIFGQRYDSTGAAQGAEFLVSADEGAYNSNPAVAMDADGDFVISWDRGFENTTPEGVTYMEHTVFAQRYDSVGNAQGTEFSFGLSNSFMDPAVAMDADGDFVVAWMSGDQDGSGYGIYAQRYDSTGVALGTEFLVNTTTLNNQEMPAVAMDADGNFVVSWQSYDQDSSGSGIYGQRYDSTGTAQGTEFLVNATTSNNQEMPAVAMDADGDFVISWQNFAAGYDIYAQRYADMPSLTIPADPQQVVDGTILRNFKYEFLGLTDHGNVMVR